MFVAVLESGIWVSKPLVDRIDSSDWLKGVLDYTDSLFDFVGTEIMHCRFVNLNTIHIAGSSLHWCDCIHYKTKGRMYDFVSLDAREASRMQPPAVGIAAALCNFSKIGTIYIEVRYYRDHIYIATMSSYCKLVVEQDV